MVAYLERAANGVYASVLRSPPHRCQFRVSGLVLPEASAVGCQRLLAQVRVIARLQGTPCSKLSLTVLRLL
jgi:hypothetical protein